MKFSSGNELKVEGSASSVISFLEDRNSLKLTVKPTELRASFYNDVVELKILNESREIFTVSEKFVKEIFSMAGLRFSSLNRLSAETIASLINDALVLLPDDELIIIHNGTIAFTAIRKTDRIPSFVMLVNLFRQSERVSFSVTAHHYAFRVNLVNCTYFNRHISALSIFSRFSKPREVTMRLNSTPGFIQEKNELFIDNLLVSKQIEKDTVSEGFAMMDDYNSNNYIENSIALNHYYSHNDPIDKLLHYLHSLHLEVKIDM